VVVDLATNSISTKDADGTITASYALTYDGAVKFIGQFTEATWVYDATIEIFCAIWDDFCVDGYPDLV
jgi:hypothetical protein